MPGRLRTSLLALLAGLLICFAMPPWGWWPLVFGGIALWLYLLDGASLKRRLWVGWLVAVTWFGPSTLWMWGLTAPGYPVGVAIGWGPMVAITSALCPPDRRRLFVLPAAIIGFEWFHSHAPFGGAPLSMLAMTQDETPLLSIARLGGGLLLGGVVAALGSALYLALRREWKPAVAIVATAAVLSVGGALWPLGDSAGEITIAAVQGGGPQETRYDPAQEQVVFERHLDATRSIPDDADIDLVVWPENTINADGDFADHPWRFVMANEAARLDVPILIAAVDDGVDEKSFDNYVVVMHPDGELGDRYDKERRVPFGEYVPMRWLFEPLAGGALPGRDQIPGEGVAEVDTEAGPMAVVISWEVFFGRRVREGVRAGGEVVLNPTNGSSYWLTQVQSQQIATSRLRAMESGRWLVQISPTGFSAFIDPDGGVHQRTGISEAAVITQTIDKYTATTPAQALGDLPALLLAAIAAAVALAMGRVPRSPEESDSPTEAASAPSAPES